MSRDPEHTHCLTVQDQKCWRQVEHSIVHCMFKVDHISGMPRGADFRACLAHRMKGFNFGSERLKVTLISDSWCWTCLNFTHRYQYKMMTFYTQKDKGQLYCDIIMSLAITQHHNSQPYLTLFPDIWSELLTLILNSRLKTGCLDLLCCCSEHVCDTCR